MGAQQRAAWPRPGEPLDSGAQAGDLVTSECRFRLQSPWRAPLGRSETREGGPRQRGAQAAGRGGRRPLGGPGRPWSLANLLVNDSGGGGAPNGGSRGDSWSPGARWEGPGVGRGGRFSVSQSARPWEYGDRERNVSPRATHAPRPAPGRTAASTRRAAGRGEVAAAKRRSPYPGSASEPASSPGTL